MSYKFSQSKKTGFTLIELLVSVAIGLVLSSFAIGSFLDYLDKKNVSNAVDELKAFFQKAESDAKVGNLGGCNQLAGYRVTSSKTCNITRVTSQAVCIVGTPGLAKSFEIEQNIDITPNLDLTFKVLHAGVDIAGGLASTDITVANENNTYVFTVFREGRFSEGSWQ